MAPPAERPSSDRAGGLTNLQKRILSAAVLLPLVIAAIWRGSPWFSVLVAVFAAVMAWEWTRIVAHERSPGATSPVPVPTAPGWRSIMFFPVVTAIGAVLAAGSFESTVMMLTVNSASLDAASGPGMAARIQSVALASAVNHALFAAAVGAVLTGVAACVANRPKALWFMAGVPYVALPAAALVLIRVDPDHGRAALFWIIALVVAADTGGYLVGRTVGGPKLVPRISPNKTWSGLGGAVAGAALVGLLTAFILNHTNVLMLTLVSAVLGLLEQGGDLVESAFKRHFGVKDTSQIIPGHGGVLDRVDGLLAVAVAVLVINLLAGGSVLAW
jgi:phosphatidate cytidylyltransferase